MGLTIQGDIPIIYEKLEKLESFINDNLQTIFKEVEALKEIINESDVLLEADASWDVVRKKRDFLLKSTDWTLVPGATVDQSAWASYRQVLRDLPQTYGNFGLDKLVWPQKPSLKGPNSVKKKNQLQ